MIPDDLLPAAFAMVSSPKRYALFLGSGISRAAGIPTGWEITVSMIKKIAATSQEEIDGDPVAWYRERAGTDPTFSGLFGDLQASLEDQEAVLREYFTVEGEDGERVAPEPTRAHRTIGRMVRDGLVGLIITTNFDDLLERALRDVGVQPTVITEGSERVKMSVIPDHCRIVKVNGDYPNTPLKMTPADLTSYAPDLEDYLDRILSEYGLIVCGWSAKDDTGLVNILAGDERETERVRRYSVYWCQRKDSAPVPAAITESLHPSTIEIASADEFFDELHTRAEILRRHHRSEPLTPVLAVRKIKEALTGPSPELVVPDVLNIEVEKVLAEIEKERYLSPEKIEAQAVYLRRLAEIEEVAMPLAAMLATLAYYDRDGEHAALIADAVERLMNSREIELFAGSLPDDREIRDLETGLKNLRYYPALLSVYAAGIAAVKQDGLTTLDAVISKPQLFGRHGFYQQKTEYFDCLNIWNILECDQDWIVDQGLETFGNAEYLFYTYPFRTIQSILKPLIPNEKRYAEYFDIFEYLYCTAFLDSHREGWDSFQPQRYRQNFRMKFVYLSCGSEFSGTPAIPSHVLNYLAGMARRMEGTEFFKGDPDRFERAGKKVAAVLGVQAPESVAGDLEKRVI